ncbi:MAG: sensor histidine kinase, partial [Termitinemataceae bacterium]
QDINIYTDKEIQAEMQKAKAEVRNYFIFPHRKANGEIATVEVVSSPVYAPRYGKQLLLSVILDASYKKMLPEDSLEYQQRLTRMVEEKSKEIVRERTKVIVVASVVVVLVLVLILLSYILAAAHQNQKKRKLMFRELQHRLKNSFSILTGLVSLEKSEIDDERIREILSVVEGRIYSLAQLYDLLYKTEAVDTIDCIEYVELVLNYLEELYKGNEGSERHIHFLSNLTAWPCSSRKIMNIGIILNELVTNAVKHGDPAAVIFVVLNKNHDSFVTVTVKNKILKDPTGTKEGVVEQSLGMTIVQNLATELGGTSRFEIRGDAAEVQVTIPF